MHPILSSLSALDGVALLDEAALDAYLVADAGRLTVLFFAGDPDKKLETADVAIVVRELIKLYGGRLRVGLVAAEAERAAMRRCKVSVFPSLSFFAGERHLETIPKIQDWSVYAEKLPALLGEAVGAPAA